jgi:hypothetical protein
MSALEGPGKAYESAGMAAYLYRRTYLEGNRELAWLTECHPEEIPTRVEELGPGYVGNEVGLEVSLRTGFEEE